MSDFAPVLIITLNRYEHLKRGIDSLAANKFADKTDLIIALDYPLFEGHWEGYKKITTYLGKIKGFQSINIIKRDVNYGRAKNYMEATNEVFNNYDRMIFTEDDNEFSTDFLSFMNKCLDLYKEREDIFSISGYNYPIKVPESYNSPVYKWVGNSAWGFGIWKDKWYKIDFTQEVVFQNVRNFLCDIDAVIKFNKIANHYIPALFYMLKENEIHGDGYISMYQFVNNMYSIFPTMSRARNFGHDGSGANCILVENDIYKDQQIYSDSKSYDLPLDIDSNEEINYILRKYFKRSYRSKLKMVSKLVLMKAGCWDFSS